MKSLHAIANHTTAFEKIKENQIQISTLQDDFAALKSMLAAVDRSANQLNHIETITRSSVRTEKKTYRLKVR